MFFEIYKTHSPKDGEVRIAFYLDGGVDQVIGGRGGGF
jgi:hypothetical protein